jgi:hypothetical protein
MEERNLHHKLGYETLLLYYWFDAIYFFADWPCFASHSVSLDLPQLEKRQLADGKWKVDGRALCNGLLIITQFYSG